MINVSSEFRELLKNDHREYLEFVKIVLKDNTELNLENEDIWENGFKVETATSSTNSFDIGSTVIGKFTLVINNIYGDFTNYNFDVARVSAQVGLILSNGTLEKVKLGEYTVDTATYNGSTITLECLDDMYKFDKPYSLSTLKYPATLYEIVQDCCTACNVILGTNTFPQSKYLVKEKPLDDNITFRQVLSWSAQIACRFAKIDRFGQLVLRWYDLNITKNGITDFYFDDMISHTVSTDDIVITGICVNVEETRVETNGDNTTEKKETVLYKKGTDDYMLSLLGNKLIQQGHGQEVADYIGNNIIGMRFRKAELSIPNNPTIEAGDSAKIDSDADVPVLDYNKEVLTYNGKYLTYKGIQYESYYFYVTNTTFYVGNWQSISCSAETQSKNSATRFSQATQLYAEARKEIAYEKTEREKALADLSHKLSTSSGLFMTQSKQPDGSTIYYMHDKQKLSDSMIIWKLTAEAFAISTDGGKTYPYGFTVTGELITRLLYAEGIDADYINTGTLVARDSKGKVVFSVNVATGDVLIDGKNIVMGSQSLEQFTQETTVNAVTGIQVGGRNLLRNSKNLIYSKYQFS